MTPDEFDAGMAVLFSVWPKEASSPQTLEVYAEVVQHLPGDVWRAAALKCVTACTFFPKPVELLTAAADLTTTPERSGDDAWGDVKRAIAAHGVYHPPDGAQYGDFQNYFWEFKDRLVGKLVRAFGWTYLCQSEDEMADRAHFRKSYETEQRREREQARLTPDLLSFQETHRAQLAAAPVGRAAEAAALLAAVGRGKERGA